MAASTVVEPAWWSERSPRCRAPLKGRAKGYAFGITAVCMVSPDAMLCRLPSSQESVWLVTACRCTWVMLFCVVTSILQAGGIRALLSRTRAHVRPLLLVSTMSTTTSLGFPLALQLTGSAEALLLMSLNPLWGAITVSYTHLTLPTTVSV